ncbi:Fatty acyl-CoA reductase wat [Araneus ventricosus]|uniref:Fatty acyl-CoA reductase wat n=1 Tax=Araneus ventricosus TaxID=182803 RepID=A0A4Y2GGN9_ARAVE|nr:Fatty acyl-CoA reductase wat [Araneus ventricosus]
MRKIILLEDSNIKLTYWNLELIPGHHGHARLALVKTEHSGFLRPVQRLSRLEFDNSVEKGSNDVLSLTISSGRIVKAPEHFRNVLFKLKFCIEITILPSCIWLRVLPLYPDNRFATPSLAVLTPWGQGGRKEEIGKGFIKVGKGNPNCKLNFVPADIVANAHVLAAWSVGTKRCASPLVINCTATENLHVNICECSRNIVQMANEFPLPRSFDEHTNLIIVPYKYLYCIIAAYYHYLPAIVLDGMLRILGKKPRIYSLYRFLDSVTTSLNYFAFYTFEFERNNFEYLDKVIHPEDRKDLTLDFEDATFLGMALSFPEGSPFYDWKVDKKSEWERQRIKHKRHMLISCIQGMFLVICCLLIYWVFSSIFR